MSIAAAAAGEERGNKFISIQTCLKNKKNKKKGSVTGIPKENKLLGRRKMKKWSKKERLNGLFHLRLAC